MRARALAVHACPRARGRSRRRLLLSATRRQRRKVDKCCVADKKHTDKQTNLHYSFIDVCIHVPIPNSASSVKLGFALDVVSKVEIGLFSM